MKGMKPKLHLLTNANAGTPLIFTKVESLGVHGAGD